MRGRYEIVCETRRGFHASLGRGDPCTRYKRRGGTSSLLEGFGGRNVRIGSGSLAPRGERVRVRDICAARLSVAPHGISETLVPHPTLEDERRPLPTGGEAISGEGLSPTRNKVGF
jgi:hypothetical protein